MSGTWNSSLSQQCGYQNLETDDGAPAFVRQNLKDLDVSVLMRFSLGACEEYTNVSDHDPRAALALWVWHGGGITGLFHEKQAPRTSLYSNTTTN